LNLLRGTIRDGGLIGYFYAWLSQKAGRKVTSDGMQNGNISINTAFLVDPKDSWRVNFLLAVQSSICEHIVNLTIILSVVIDNAFTYGSCTLSCVSSHRNG
jgi:hypothetical protein